MRAAHDTDQIWIEARLRADIETSMFSLGNLAEHGWHSDAPRAMQFWVNRDAGHVLGVSNEGMLMPQMAGGDFDAVRPILKGHHILGGLGETNQLRALLSALGLEGQRAPMNEDEPQLSLDLVDLVVPDGPGKLIPFEDADPSLTYRWRKAYAKEVMGMDDLRATKIADRDIPVFASSDRFRVLVVDGKPVGMTGWNARLREIVQVGGVYVPPEFRMRGHARRALALHLNEVRQKGVTRATLCAANSSARRAYEAIGFRQIGQFTITQFYETVLIT